MRPQVEKVEHAPDESFRYLFRQDPSFRFDWHCHREFELTAIIRSSGQRYVGDSIEPYADGDLVLCGPNLPHTWASQDETNAQAASELLEAVAVQFRGDVLEQSFGHLPEMKSVADLLARASRGLVFEHAAASDVLPRLIAMRELRGLSRLTQLLLILDQLSHAPARVLCTRAYADTTRAADQTRIDHVLRYINEHFDEPLTQPRIARMAHTTPAAFCRLFKRCTGSTFVDYVNELRVGRVCRLLIETDRSVTAICQACGFANLSNFNRRFRTARGMNPREFRRKYRKNV